MKFSSLKFICINSGCDSCNSPKNCENSCPSSIFKGMHFFLIKELFLNSTSSFSFFNIFSLNSGIICSNDFSSSFKLVKTWYSSIFDISGKLSSFSVRVYVLRIWIKISFFCVKVFFKGSKCDSFNLGIVFNLFNVFCFIRLFGETLSSSSSFIFFNVLLFIIFFELSFLLFCFLVSSGSFFSLSSVIISTDFSLTISIASSWFLSSFSFFKLSLISFSFFISSFFSFFSSFGSSSFSDKISIDFISSESSSFFIILFFRIFFLFSFSFVSLLLFSDLLSLSFSSGLIFLELFWFSFIFELKVFCLFNSSLILLNSLSYNSSSVSFLSSFLLFSWLILISFTPFSCFSFSVSLSIFSWLSFFLLFSLLFVFLKLFNSFWLLGSKNSISSTTSSLFFISNWLISSSLLSLLFKFWLIPFWLSLFSSFLGDFSLLILFLLLLSSWGLFTFSVISGIETSSSKLFSLISITSLSRSLLLVFFLFLFFSSLLLLFSISFSDIFKLSSLLLLILSFKFFSLLSLLIILLFIFSLSFEFSLFELVSKLIIRFGDTILLLFKLLLTLFKFSLVESGILNFKLLLLLLFSGKPGVSEIFKPLFIFIKLLELLLALFLEEKLLYGLLIWLSGLLILFKLFLILLLLLVSILLLTLSISNVLISNLGIFFKASILSFNLDNNKLMSPTKSSFSFCFNSSLYIFLWPKSRLSNNFNSLIFSLSSIIFKLNLIL